MFVREVASRIYSSCVETACLVAANRRAVCTDALVMTYRHADELLSDITERKRAEEALRRRAASDELMTTSRNPSIPIRSGVKSKCT